MRVVDYGGKVKVLPDLKKSADTLPVAPGNELIALIRESPAMSLMGFGVPVLPYRQATTPEVVVDRRKGQGTAIIDSTRMVGGKRLSRVTSL